MAQLTIYLDDQTRRRIQQAAAQESLSISSWVKNKLQCALQREWPEGYFELFGSLAGVELERPVQPRLEDDSPRGAI